MVREDLQRRGAASPAQLIQAGHVAASSASEASLSRLQSAVHSAILEEAEEEGSSSEYLREGPHPVPPARPPSRGVTSSSIRRVPADVLNSPQGVYNGSPRTKAHGRAESPRPSSAASLKGMGKKSSYTGAGYLVRHSSEESNTLEDGLGPRLVESAGQLTDLLNGAGQVWGTLNTLIASAIKERSDLMRTVVRQEEHIAQLAEEIELARAEGREALELLRVKMEREADEAFAAARREWMMEQQQTIQLMRQEEEKIRADAVAAATEAGEIDKAIALAAARETAEQELMEALAVLRQRAEEEKLEALAALRQRAEQERREALALQAQQFELEKQGSVAVAAERAEQAKERALAEEREKQAAERKRAVAQERDRQQQEKYRALAEERERAKMALARAEAVDNERIRQERARAALEIAAAQQKSTCSRCAQEFIVQDNEVGSCKCCYNSSSIAQVHVEGLLWHAGAELTNWVKMRRRWSCCPQNEVYGTLADLQKIGCKAHVPSS